MLIALDLDEVLADFSTALIKFHNDTYSTSLTRDKIFTYSFWKVWGGTRGEAIQKVRKFYFTKYFKDMKPVPGSVYGVGEIIERHELVIITSRPNDFIEETSRWIEKYFPSRFNDIYFAYNQWIREKGNESKLEICLNLGVDVLIEDSLEYAKECAKEGIEVLLLDCPWNQTKKLPKRIKRVYNWREISDTIYS